MTHSPPVPEGNTSPYPIQEPPHESETAKSPVANLPVVRREKANGQPVAALGAAIIAGIAAAVGGLLLWRRGRR